MDNVTPITGWLKQPLMSTGLDHIGSQAPCINLYGRLLPSITNVTDRARYYSFYPWFFWAYEKQFKTLAWNEIIERFRRADCLFTLIAEQHEQNTDKDHNQHGIATVGRNTLVVPLRKLVKGHYLKLSTYSTRNPEGGNRYFKNRFGGLGQYYQGTLIELGLLDITGSDRSIKYTRERGAVIAEKFDAGVDRNLFFKTIENDLVDHEILDQLQTFCPCFLSQNKPEHEALLDLFFDRNDVYDDSGKQRRHTLCLILHLIEVMDSQGFLFNQENFRAASYTGHLPEGLSWEVPEALKSTRYLWGIYQRNELLSIAVQSLFWVALEMLDKMDPKPFTSVEFIRRWGKTKVFQNAVSRFGDQPLQDIVLQIQENTLPQLKDWQDANHEITIGNLLPSKIRNKDKKQAYIETIIDTIAIILNLVARDDATSPAYADLEYPPGYFEYYPVNLLRFKEHINSSWYNLALKDLLKWLVQYWGIETHFRISLRKMRNDQQNKFRVYPSEIGLKVDGAPEPVFTNPRFNQGVQILRDLNLIIPKKNRQTFELTAAGKKILENAIVQ